MSRIVTEAAQAFSFSRRAMVLGGAQAAVGVVLAARMAWLSVAENERYNLLAESNRVNLTMIPPRRGWIIDRHGAPIANNRTDFRVDLIPDRMEDGVRVLGELQQLLALTAEDMARIQTDLKRAGNFTPVQVAENLDWERFAAVSVRLPELPGVQPTRGFSRSYPPGAAVAHLTGYVGAATAEQFKETRDPLMVTPGFKLGKDGLEKTLESDLRGAAGAKRVEVTARGQIVRELETRPDKQGKNVRLTIDLGLQEYAARRLGPNSGSAVVMDAVTGDVLAMVSMPAYDPNSFSDGIGRLEWKMLSDDDHIPLMNKTLQGLYPPGSTVKPMHALAILQAGIDPHRRVNCTGVLQVGTGRFHCHKRGGHGPLDMVGAVAQSCDIYFYTMARELGYDRFAPVARAMGLGQEYELPFQSQRYGTVPDSAWKLRKYKQKWTVADSVNASIGQGYVLTNPLQLAVMAARIAQGRRVVPRLLLDTPHRPAPSMNIDQDMLDTVHKATWAVINGGGTGGRSRFQGLPGIELAGKTGTAQVRRITMAERRTGVLGDGALPFKMRDHSLFIGYAPANAPRYAVSVVLEHSGHIYTAAPIASDILSWLFDRDKAMARLEPLEREWGGDINARMATQWRSFQAAQQAPVLSVPATPADVEGATTNVVDSAVANQIEPDPAVAQSNETRRTE
ncbi:penicillin-binding protein 2 [Sphingomonas sp. Leaf10]|uniref:penicillin-binding protein 2 n=1 Tax=Sphingomonas sp. Leaf10 TaxID=1735676 RepID=UPI0006FA7C64|nr:penicillin-binding protein 2 [Sphingomonas sp. Leaf10]KQM41328.1 penicillin-binding protein 2 [Sphingomonas sp. Leaf10]